MTDIELLKDAIGTLNGIMLPVGLKTQIDQIGAVAYNLQQLLNAIEANIEKARKEQEGSAASEETASDDDEPKIVDMGVIKPEEVQ